MDRIPKLGLYTLEEYFFLEERSLEKHEFYQGRIYKLHGNYNYKRSFNGIGLSPEHALISANAITALGNALCNMNCLVYSSDVLIQVQSKNFYTFADTSVVYAKPEYAEVKNNRFLTNPALIVEVLSPPTENYDRGTKFQLYKAISSLQDYLLIDSCRIHVQHYRKLDNNTWLEKTYTRIGEVITFEQLGLEITLKDIYSQRAFHK